jgi:uncharacterized protein (DUF362 family)
MKETDVILYKCPMEEYPLPPYSAPQKYPEYPFKETAKLNTDNYVYEAIRSILLLSGMDKGNANTADWNPFGSFIKPGDRVLINPNFISHINHNRGCSILTHGSIITPIVDYVIIALKGKGEILIGDAPYQKANFNEILKLLNIGKLSQFYSGRSNVTIDVVDLRQERVFVDKNGMIAKRIPLSGDPKGYIVVDLEKSSELSEIADFSSRFRVTQYNKDIIINHHNKHHHQYVISRSALESDVIINLPKLKTHCKAGMTAALKNLIGLVGSKACLPHHRRGSMGDGGDEYLYPSRRKVSLTSLTELIDVSESNLRKHFLNMLKVLVNATRKTVPCNDPFLEGSWWGNDTISRTIVDINKILFYADKEGTLKNEKQREHFVLVDAIVAGEGKGPLHPTPKPCGLLIAGSNPVVIDLVCSGIMGFDYNRIRFLHHALNSKRHKLFMHSPMEINIRSNLKGQSRFRDFFESWDLTFEPPPGWKGHIR